MPKKEKSKYILWEPAHEVNESFPFTYRILPLQKDKIANITEDDIYLTIDYTHGTNLKQVIKDNVLSTFPFHRYMDVNSPEYIGRPNDLTLLIKINTYQLVSEKTKKGKEKTIAKQVDTWFVTLDNFNTEYQYNLVTSLDQLDKILLGKEEIAFDLETTGLNPLEDYIVGASLCVEPKIGYYVPICHDTEFSTYNLGFDALDIIYKHLLAAKIVDLFNAEFDMRMMEFCERHYDMSTIKYFDVQVSSWFMDPDKKDINLKWAEKYFCGYFRENLKATMKTFGADGYNFSKLDPKNSTFYAGQDAVSTFEVRYETKKFHDEFGLSGKIDQMLIFPFMRMKNYPIRIDMDYIDEQMGILIPRLNELNEIIFNLIGDVNLNSPKQKLALFESFNLDTGILTDTGNMSTSMDAIEEMVERMEENEEEIPEWLRYINERAKLEKLRSTYFSSLAEQARMNDGRIRINYRNTSVATGRLSSGGYLDN